MRSQTPSGVLTGLALAAAAMLGTGCGNLTIRTWVKVIEDQTTGAVVINGSPSPLERVQGGFFANVQVDTNDVLTGLTGTIALEDIRIAAFNPPPAGIAGTVCAWADPANPTAGDITIDVLGGGGAASVAATLKATTTLTDGFGLPPIILAQDLDLPLGSGLGIEQFLGALTAGSADGLFTTSVDFVGDAVLLGIAAQFQLNLQVTNAGTPPLFDADYLAFCDEFFAEQGSGLFWGVNAKASYLLADKDDAPKPPLAIKLSDVGAVPGDTLRLARVGTFSAVTELRDGTLTDVTGVFSSSNVVRAASERNRIAGAIDAGVDVATGSVKRCVLLIFCSQKPTDIAQDFRIDPQVDVTVPAGAEYLFVAALPPKLFYKDNSGFGFGVSVEVNP